MARRVRGERRLGSVSGGLRSDVGTLSTSYRIEGLSQLKAKLASLEKSVRREVMREAGLHALDMIADEARTLCPTGATGKLRASIRVGVPVSAKAASLAGIRQKYFIAGAEVTGATGESATHTRVYMGAGHGALGEVYYSHFVEYGTVKMAAQPFMRPAVDQKGAAALRDLAFFFEVAIRKAAKSGGGIGANDNQRYRLTA
jgi:HK97 gp10 family phage protein